MAEEYNRLNSKKHKKEGESKGAPKKLKPYLFWLEETGLF